MILDGAQLFSLHNWGHKSSITIERERYFDAIGVIDSQSQLKSVLKAGVEPS